MLEKSKKYPPEIMVKKAVYKGFALAQDYLRYINDAIFGTELTNDGINNKILTKKIEETYFDLHWQPVANKGIKDKIIEEDKSRNHIFNLLGSGDVKLSYKLRAK